MERRTRQAKTGGKAGKRTWGAQRSQKQEKGRRDHRASCGGRLCPASSLSKRPVFDRRSVQAVTQEEIIANQAAIYEFKSREVLCAFCGQPIRELAGAIADRGSGRPVHFDCALERVQEAEHVQEPDKIVYIGQGRFGVVCFGDSREPRSFTIKRVIEWESRDARYEWRDDIASLYSKIK